MNTLKFFLLIELNSICFQGADLWQMALRPTSIKALFLWVLFTMHRTMARVDVYGFVTCCKDLGRKHWQFTGRQKRIVKYLFGSQKASPAGTGFMVRFSSAPFQTFRYRIGLLHLFLDLLKRSRPSYSFLSSNGQNHQLSDVGTISYIKTSRPKKKTVRTYRLHLVEIFSELLLIPSPQHQHRERTNKASRQ